MTSASTSHGKVTAILAATHRQDHRCEDADGPTDRWTARSGSIRSISAAADIQAPVPASPMCRRAANHSGFSIAKTSYGLVARADGKREIPPLSPSCFPI